MNDIYSINHQNYSKLNPVLYEIRLNFERSCNIRAVLCRSLRNTGGLFQQK